MIDEEAVNRIKSHDVFFSRIIEMIPDELYKPSEVNPILTNSKYYKVLHPLDSMIYLETISFISIEDCR